MTYAPYLVESIQQFIRSNGCAWPGGYPTALMMADGEVLCAQAARENYRLIRSAMRAPGSNTDWEPVGVSIYWEGVPLTCAHSGRQIFPAYQGEQE